MSVRRHRIPIGLDFIRSGSVGLVAGLFATVPMSMVFSLAQSLGAIRQLPPHKAVTVISPQIEEPGRSAVATIAHFMVGGSAGALYGVATALDRRSRGPVSGLLFGLVVWAFGYEVFMPSMVGMPRAHRDRRRRAVTILIAHVVYGLSLGAAVRAGTRRAT
jgi:hypothetical protein